MGGGMFRLSLSLATMAGVTRAGMGCGPANSLPFTSPMGWEDWTWIPAEGDELWGSCLLFSKSLTLWWGN